MNPNNKSVQPLESAEPEDIVMRLAARYGTRETLQADVDGKIVAIRTIGMDEHGLRLFFKALKKLESNKAES